MSAEQAGEYDAVILYTNDTHCAISNMVKDDDGNEVRGLSFASVAALKKELNGQGENVLLVDAGDHIQGTAYGSFDEGETIVRIMNAAGYDAATLGNHEFDYGIDRMKELVSEAEYSYTSCSFFETASGSPVLPSFVVREVGGVRVAFVGIATPESLTNSAPSKFQDENGQFLYRFKGLQNAQELYDAVQQAIDGARQQADYVIALGHLGDDPASMSFRSRDVIANVTGLDAFIDGHSHSVIPQEMVKDASGREVPLTQTGVSFRYIGRMNLKDGAVTTELIERCEIRDETVAAMEEKQINLVQEALGQVIAKSDIDFLIADPDNPDQRIIRLMETNLGNLVTDSFYYYLNEVEQLHCDFAICNGGGMRDGIPAGEISYLSCKNVLSRGNIICLVSVTGQQILDALEWTCKELGTFDENGNRIEASSLTHASGIQYAVDLSVPSTVVGDAEDMWAAAPTDGYRVHDVKVYDRASGSYEPLELDRVYTIGGTNYQLRNGGSGLSMFQNSELVKDYVGEDYLVFAAYLSSFAPDETGIPVICTEGSPLNAYPGFLLQYEQPLGSGRLILTE